MGGIPFLFGANRPQSAFGATEERSSGSQIRGENRVEKRMDLAVPYFFEGLP
jgi:hypothetical protein